MKRLVAVLLSVVMLSGLIVPELAYATSPTTNDPSQADLVLLLEADKTTVNPGDTVTVSVKVTKNAGFMMFGAKPNFDKNLFTQPGNVTYGGIGSGTKGKNASIDGGSEDNTETGLLFTYTLTVKDSALPGSTVLLGVHDLDVQDIDEEGVSCYANHVEVTILAPCEHTSTNTVQENLVNATCTAAGSYDEVVYCTVCGAELSRTAKTIQATGHAWGEVSYTWSADNKTCTASRTCTTDVNHVETETAQANVEKTDEATTYTATFENEAFETQSKVVPAFVWGDANGDGEVDPKDLARLKNCLANYDSETDTSTYILGPAPKV